MPRRSVIEIIIRSNDVFCNKEQFLLRKASPLRYNENSFCYAAEHEILMRHCASELLNHKACY